MNSKRSIWHLLTLLTLLVAPVYLALEWASLPAQVPLHFDVSGQPNRYGDKDSLLILCLLPVGVYLLMSFLPRFDPKRKVDTANPNFQKLMLALVALLAGVACYIMYVALNGGGGTMATRLMSAGIGVFMALMGNYLTTVPPNYFVGIRTPWTLESPVVWARTHRLGGRLFFWTGIIGVVLAVVAPVTVANTIEMGLIGMTVVVVLAYSYWQYRQASAAV